MSIKEGFQYLPESKEPEHAFNKINQAYFRAKSPEEIIALPPERQGKIIKDYISTAVAYLANYSDDPFIENLGTLGWKQIVTNQVEIGYDHDARKGAQKAGLPIRDAMQLSPEEPNFFIAVDQSQDTLTPRAVSVFPPHFIIKSQQHPLDALGTMAFILSNVRDFANRRYLIDTSETIAKRAEAAEAQFFLKLKNPLIVIGNTGQAALQAYPRGLDSLPPAARYPDLPTLK